MVKQNITINGRTLYWDVPDKVKKKKKRQKRKKSNRFKTVSEINIISFLKEHPYFSLDTPTIIDEPDKEWFKKQFIKDLKNMIKAVGLVEI